MDDRCLGVDVSPIGGCLCGAGVAAWGSREELQCFVGVFGVYGAALLAHRTEQVCCYGVLWFLFFLLLFFLFFLLFTTHNINTQVMHHALTNLTSMLTTHHASLTTITTTIRNPSITTGLTLVQTAEQLQDVGGGMLSMLRVLGRAIMLRQMLADAVDSKTRVLLPHVAWVCGFYVCDGGFV